MTDPTDRDALEAAQPRLYRASTLTIRPDGRPVPDFLRSGEYHDERDVRVGSFRVRAAPNLHWHHRAETITELIDGDGMVFMVVAHERRRDVVADPDGTELGGFRPRPQFTGARLQVLVNLPGFGDGRLRERRRRTRGRRIFDLTFESDEGSSTIERHFPEDGGEHIELVHAEDATPPQRCAALALATCLPQLEPVAATGITLGPIY